MLRNFKTTLSLLGIAAAVALGASSAMANLFVDIQVNSTSYGYSAATPRAAAVGSLASQQTFLLDVYALITPNGTNTVDATKLGLSAIASNFLVANSTLKGDVSFQGWNSSGVPSVSTVSSTKGFTSMTGFGGIGLGGTATGDNTTSHWWVANMATLNATGGIVVPGVGVEYLLGTIQVTFTGYTLPTATTSAVMGSVPFYGGATTKKYNIVQDGAGTGNLNGNSALVAFGASSTSLLYGSGNVVGGNVGSSGIVPMTFTYTTNTPVNNPAAMTANLGITGPTVGLGGSALTLAGTVSNTGTSPANNLNWSALPLPGGVALSPASAGNVAVGTPSTPTGTLTLPTALFGPYATTVTITGTDAVNSGTTFTSSQNLAATIIGKGTTSFAGSDGTGTPGGPYYNTVTTQGAQPIINLVSTLGTSATSFGIGATTATILAGTATGTITESWRPRAANELPIPGNLPLYSDVLSLTGVPVVSGTTTAPYALQMTYDPSQLGGTSRAQTAASQGFLYLGYRDASGRWTNAVNGNSGAPYAGAEPILSDFSTFLGANGGAANLANLVGAWGVDTTKNTVWAVINHDAEFAAVPEPGTIALLVGGLIALGVAYRRRVAK